MAEQAKRVGLMSEGHFTVDGTLLKAWASHKSIKPREGVPKDPAPDVDSKNETVDFRNEKRTDETHRSTADPDARLYRKGENSGAEPSYMAHVLMKKRNGLVAEAHATHATGRAERETAIRMVEHRFSRHV